MLTSSSWEDMSTVTLIVGKSRTMFQVHESVLFNLSPVFRAGFTSDFKESVERQMSLPEDDAELFNVMVGWFYSRHYDISPPTGDRLIDCTRFVEPTRLYVLADKYAITKLKNNIAESMFNAMRLGGSAGPSIDTIAYVYQNVSRTSGIRKLLADFHACNIKYEWFELATAQRFLQKNPKFAVDILMSFVQHTSVKTKQNPFRGEMPEAYRDEE